MREEPPLVIEENSYIERAIVIVVWVEVASDHPHAPGSPVRVYNEATDITVAVCLLPQNALAHDLSRLHIAHVHRRISLNCRTGIGSITSKFQPCQVQPLSPMLTTSLFHVMDTIDTHLDKIYGQVQKVWESLKEVVRSIFNDRVLSVVHENIRMVLPVWFETYVFLFRATKSMSATYGVDEHGQSYFLPISWPKRKCLI